MKSLETQQSAPERFTGPCKPSRLAEQFGEFAREMLSEGSAKRHRNIIYMSKEGMEVRFDKKENEEFVDAVMVADYSFPEPFIYRINFTPGNPGRQTYEDDYSRAEFLVMRELPCESRYITNHFERGLIRPGDYEVNEFLRDMTEAIQNNTAKPPTMS